MYTDMAAQKTKSTISEGGRSVQTIKMFDFNENRAAGASSSPRLRSLSSYGKGIPAESKQKQTEILKNSHSSESGGRPESSTSSENPSSKVGRKRTRASRVAPTIVVNTDVSTFRAKVQKFTGMQTPETQEISSNSMPLNPTAPRPVDQTFMVPSYYKNSHSNDITKFSSTTASPPFSFPSMWPATSVPTFTFHPFLQQQQQQQPSYGTPFGLHPFFSIMPSNADNNRNTY